MKNPSHATRRSSFSLSAPAKINWFLKVIGKRDDGYHDIISLMQCISLYDELKFGYSSTIELISDLDIPVKENLVFRAASLLKQYTSYKKGAKIILQKNIPVGSGLGGGSSDAAHTLLGLDRLWGLGLSNSELSIIGAEIGSDVPFFLNGSSAFVEGRGERVTPYKIKPSVMLILIKPPIFVSTAWAYTNISELTKKPVDIKLFCQAFKKQDFASLNTVLINDLEKVVIDKYPVVGEIKNRLLKEGAVISAMSGSGPTVFGVFESKKVALNVVKKMGINNWCKVVETLI